MLILDRAWYPIFFVAKLQSLWRAILYSKSLQVPAFRAQMSNVAWLCFISRDFWFLVWHVTSSEVITPRLTTRKRRRKTENQWLFGIHQRTEVTGQTTSLKAEEGGTGNQSLLELKLQLREQWKEKWLIPVSWVWTSSRENQHPCGPSLGRGGGTFVWVFSPRNPTRLSRWRSGNNPCLLQAGGGESNHSEIYPEHLLSLTEACHQRKLFHQSLTSLGFTRV